MMSCRQCNDTGISVPSTWTSGPNGGTTVYHTERARTCKLCDGTGQQKRAWAFSCGTEFGAWKARNCAECIRGYNGDWRCDIERAHDEAYMRDGLVTLDIIERMGRSGDCKERVE